MPVETTSQSTTRQHSPLRYAEDKVAKLQRRTDRTAITGYQDRLNLSVDKARDQHNGRAMAAALTLRNAVVGARIGRSLATWLALTAPMDLIVGQSRLRDEELPPLQSLITSGHCSPYAIIGGTLVALAAPVGGIAGTVVGAVRASVARQSKAQWLATVRSDAERGAFVLPLLAAALVDTVLGYTLLGAQLLVAGLKAAVAVVGALVGLSVGLPMVAWQVGGMLVDEAQAAFAQNKADAALRRTGQQVAQQDDQA